MHCGARVVPVTNGSYRNHCPFCLWSLHVDSKPGDRASVCRGPMTPIGFKHSKKGLQVVHQCMACGKRQPNIVARGTAQDDFEAVLRLMEREVSQAT